MKKATACLEGIRVLDMTQFLSGPFCTMNLGDLGADVIRIERPDRVIGGAPFLNGERVYDLVLNRSKRGITMNLKDAQERENFLKLVERSDVVVENMRPGSMQKLGLSYEVLKSRNPKIIYLSITGFGQTGPYSQKGALDLVIQAMSGMMSMTGESDGPAMKVGPSITDILTGLYGIIGILAALQYRNRTGCGQYIDLAMLDSAFSCLENAVGNYFATGVCPTRSGNRQLASAPFQPYPTIDGEIIITAPRDHLFQALCQGIGCPKLADDARFATTTARKANIDALEVALSQITRTMTTEELERRLDAVGVPTGRINTVEMAANDPQIIAREMIWEVDHPIAGRYKMSGNPLKFSETPLRPNRAAPSLGQHNVEIYQNELGMEPEELTAMLQQHASMKR